MDPLSDVLALLKPRSSMCGGLDAGGTWSLQYPAKEGIKCYAVVSGALWLVVEGEPQPHRIESGDCFLLLGTAPFRLTNDLAAPPVDVLSLIRVPLNGAVFTLNGGGATFGVAAFFLLNPTHADILLAELPRVIHIRREADKAALRWSIERMMAELRDPQPGGSLIAQQLASMILVQALRLHLAERAQAATGWIFALADPQMRAALSAMHGEPAHPWTLQTLAEHAAMSRSVFAQRFRQTVGSSPIEYLTRWRMLLAADRLATSTEPVSAIAQSLGYVSESAFSQAFKRVMGASPRSYRPALAARRTAPSPTQTAPLPSSTLDTPLPYLSA